ncbi:hypothetical protein [Methylorubrum extorquens]
MAWNPGMTYVRGTSGNDDARAVDDPDGSHINTGAGDDILRGGVYDDLIVGGSGNDQYWGGGGGDEFRFISAHRLKAAQTQIKFTT